MADKIVQAKVTKPTFINGSLHFPGEATNANLDQLGVDSLDAKNVSSLEPLGKNEASDLIERVQVAPVAPHAPDPTAPQGLAPGSVISGTGKTLSPPGADADVLATEMVPPEAPAKKK